jgi:hypothetical protein
MIKTRRNTYSPNRPKSVFCNSLIAVSVRLGESIGDGPVVGIPAPSHKRVGSRVPLAFVESEMSWGYRSLLRKSGQDPGKTKILP